MNNLFEMLAGAQGGQGLGNIARQFGLGEEQAQQALEGLLPAFTTGLRRNTQTPQGLEGFINALGSNRHGSYFEQPDAAFSQRGIDEGNGILGHIFGTKEVSRRVADQVSSDTGIGADILKKMLPSLASMLMGGMAQQAPRQPGLQDIFANITGGGGARQTAGQGGGLGELIGGLFGGGQQSQQPQTGADIFGQLFESGGPQRRSQQQSMDSIFEQILGR